MAKTLNRYLADRYQSRGSNFRFRYSVWTSVRHIENGKLRGYQGELTPFHIIRAVARRFVSLPTDEARQKYCDFMGLSRPEITALLEKAAVRVVRARYKDEHYLELSEESAREFLRRRKVKDEVDLMGHCTNYSEHLRQFPDKFTSQEGIYGSIITVTERQEIHAVLRRHRGSISILAAELGIFKPNLSRWLGGKGDFRDSKSDSAILARVAELKKLEGPQDPGITTTITKRRKP